MYLRNSVLHLQRRTFASLYNGGGKLALSCVEGPSEPPLISTETLGSYFRGTILEKLSDGGTRPALICRQEHPRAHGGPKVRNLGRADCLAWDYAEFAHHIDAIARGLISMGVSKGQRIGVVMGNNSAYALLQWGCARIGAILVTINPAYRAHELVDALRLAQVNHLIVVPKIRNSHYLSMLAEALPGLHGSAQGLIQEEQLPELHSIIYVNNDNAHNEEIERLNLKCLIDWREIFLWTEEPTWENHKLAQIEASLNKDDIINMQFTSGTTGLPKAVSLTHHNLLNNGHLIGEVMRFTRDDVLCNVPPLFHCFGLVIGNIAAFSHASTVVYPSEIFDAPAIVDALAHEKCTAVHGVPTHFLGMLKEINRRTNSGEKLDFSRLRTGVAAGSSVPIDLMQKLIGSMNLKELTICYGMTETSPVSFQTRPDDPLEMRTDTVGRIHPHMKAKIVDLHTREIVPVNTPGELLVAGYALQKGYWRDEDQTKKVMQPDDNGVVWIHTGDEGVLDENGYLRIVGRIKDLIIRGGENLFPVLIENTLLSHPFIYEAAAVSVPDPIYGEVVGAWIILATGTSMSKEAIRKVVSEKMNPQNAPSWVWFLEDGELPKTASGKIMKHVLREWSKDRAARGVGQVST